MSFRKGVKQKMWSQGDMDDAVQACRLQGLTSSAASRMYNVPRKTLTDRLQGKLKRISLPPLLNEDLSALSAIVSDSDDDDDEEEYMDMEALPSQEDFVETNATESPPLVTLKPIATMELEQSPSPIIEPQQSPDFAQLSHNNHFGSIVASLIRDERFVDVTLTAEGQSLKAHKSILAAMSPYFKSVLSDIACQHPVIVMPASVLLTDLVSIINYIYKGEITVDISQLSSVLQTAEILQISGLVGTGSSTVPQNSSNSHQPHNDSVTTVEEEVNSQPLNPSTRLSKTVLNNNNSNKTTISQKSSPKSNSTRKLTTRSKTDNRKLTTRTKTENRKLTTRTKTDNRKLTTRTKNDKNSGKSSTAQNVKKSIKTNKSVSGRVKREVVLGIQDHSQDSLKAKRRRQAPKCFSDYVTKLNKTVSSTVFIPISSFSSTSKRGTKDISKRRLTGANKTKTEDNPLPTDVDDMNMFKVECVEEFQGEEFH